MPGFLRRPLITLAGALLVGTGIVLLPLPGPGFLVIFAGMVVLATEYDWARNRLETARSYAREASRASVASRWRLAGTLAVATGMLVTAALVAFHPRVPFLSPWVSPGIVAGALFLAGSTLYALRMVRLEQTSPQRVGAG